MTYLVLALVTLLFLLAFWGVWLWLVARHYRPTSDRPQIVKVRTADGWDVTLHHRPAVKKRYVEPVLLSHGFAANRYTFDFDPPHSLAHALSEAGFDCYTVEWRGTGASYTPPRGRWWGDYSVDDYIRLDAPAVVDAILAHSGARQLYWLGHSLGALIGYAYAQGPNEPKLKGLLALGAPLFFHFDPLTKVASRVGALVSLPLGFRLRVLSVAMAPFLGHVTLPLSDIVVNPQAIPPHLQRKVYANLISSVSRKVMLQFQDWIANDAFRSYDKSVDYRLGIPGLTLPFLVMGGSQDKLAPPTAVQRQFELVASPDKSLAIFGPEHGEKLGYGHGDLLYGEHAPTEVYPVIQRWLEERATRVEAAEPAPPAPAG
jgi:pimeloyl-ACP methyl ester carboxylesterase